MIIKREKRVNIVPTKDQVLSALEALEVFDEEREDQHNGYRAVDVRQRTGIRNTTWELVKGVLDELVEDGKIHRVTPKGRYQPLYRSVG